MNMFLKREAKRANLTASHRRAPKQEKQLVERLGGRRTSASGAKDEKGDRIPGTNLPVIRPAIERFMANVQKIADTGCWLWTGGGDRYGDFCLGDEYGMKGKTTQAHRAACILFKGESVDTLRGLVVRHSCDTGKCVNPEHLTPGTQQENIDDAVARGRQVSGEKVGTSKLTESDVLQIYSLHWRGSTQASIARRFSVTSANIRQIITGKSWRRLYDESFFSES